MKGCLQFFAAVSLAALHACVTGRCARSGRAFLAAYARSRASLDPQLTAARLQSCRVCPIFFRPLATCGTPLRRGLRSLGCHCHMPTKAAGPANCWAYDETAGTNHIGWPAALNSFPPAAHV